MTFVALWSTAPIAEGGSALADALLAVTPHVVAAEGDEAGRLFWLDARGLPARRVAADALGIAQGADARGAAGARVGIARVPVVAAVAARHGAARVVAVRRGAEREYLAARPLAVLAATPGWSPKLAVALADVGVETCGDLAALGADAVEVRFGAEGTALWKLARGEDERRIFALTPRALPSASLEWLEFQTDDPERLLFVANRLLERICDELRAWGETARVLTLRFTLADRSTVERKIRGARASADRAAWLRLLRAELERVRLPDGVTGVALRVDAVHALDTPQGDLFDQGFQSAAAAESAVARLTDDEMGQAVRLATSAHALPEKRLRWRPMEFREVAAQVRKPGTEANPAAMGLSLRLLPSPRRVIVTTRERRGHAMPVRYRERLAPNARARRGLPLVEVIAAAGPDRVSAGLEEGTPVSREYWTCLTEEALVLLFRDLPNGEEEQKDDAPDPAPDVDARGKEETQAETRDPDQLELWYVQGWWD
ncbi:MAG TPA: hypothetical protein VHM30_12795 [Gemmatimonadaceae bacterium]|nr:hypothetical protein [Gemmatimonadaceae bacterium]